MKQTKHIGSRMNKQGIPQSMINMTVAHGRCEQDRYVLDRREIDRRLGEIDYERSLLLKARDKGGVVVVEEDNTLITTYNRI